MQIMPKEYSRGMNIMTVILILTSLDDLTSLFDKDQQLMAAVSTFH
jgi:hypothetical protein